MDDQKIPSRQQYIETCINLAQDNHLTTLIAVQMGCEMGMTRLECCNALVSNLDQFHDRGLWVEIAKRIRCSNSDDGQKMRSREIPVPPNLYIHLKNYILKGQKYILRRKIGNWKEPFAPRYINNLYERHGVFWSSHVSRHFFKNCLYDWMRKNRQIDVALVKSLLGHTLNVHESYGSISWDYKKEVIDNTFENMFFYGEQDKYDEISKILDIPAEKIKVLFTLIDDRNNGGNSFKLQALKHRNKHDRKVYSKSVLLKQRKKHDRKVYSKSEWQSFLKENLPKKASLLPHLSFGERVKACAEDYKKR